ncbi:putative ammonium transporter 3 [Oppia nitens]|uniref:putative ammonium transporter 3 n=1 Tax=Oppia nitens TaxID=1686743 RepID=UPI0023DA4B0A|nr:putative ammonium transporter 3 [Oppia nitens]
MAASDTSSRIHLLAEDISWDDATWILTSSFIIFTMQTGFSLLESGCVRRKNHVSIILKNCCDPLFSGLAFWTIGYGLSLTADTAVADGTVSHRNPFIGFGDFLVDSTQVDMGQLFATYAYRLSLISVATTIVLGAMTERITFLAYCLFSFLITIVFSVPSYWIWSPNGFLRQWLAVDVAGCSTVHLAGGMSGLIATLILKPRLGRFSQNAGTFAMSSPTNALLGTFMLWWGWVGLHMSSAFGVSNNKWKYSARSAVSTIMSSSIGGTTALLLSYLFMRHKFDIKLFICGLLSGLVSVSAGCTLYQPWESLIIGFIGSLLSIGNIPVLRLMKIDDPINTISIHLIGSIWGMLALAIFVQKDTLLQMTYNQTGLIYGGSMRLLYVQMLAIVCIAVWSALATAVILPSMRLLLAIRLSLNDELRGADFAEHNTSHEANDDTLLPQNTSLKTNKSVARMRLKKVLTALKATHRMSSYHRRNSFLKRHVKQNQTKTLAGGHLV